MSEYVGEYVVSLTAKTFTDLRSHRHEEIVRCRDCRHMRTIDLSVYYGEHKHDLDICIRVDGVQLNVEPDGFCAWGERRGDAE